MLTKTDKALIALTVLICLWGTMSLAGCSTETYSPREEKLAAMSAEQRLKDAKRLYAGGIRLVPSQIKPGTYRAVVPKDVFLCYWARLRDTNAEYNSIIANGFQKPGRSVHVTVQSGDTAFESRSCGKWTEVK